MNFSNRREEIKWLKKTYTQGTRLELLEMDDKHLKRDIYEFAYCPKA